jgi:hypothetical protein
MFFDPKLKFFECNENTGEITLVHEDGAFQFNTSEILSITKKPSWSYFFHTLHLLQLPSFYFLRKVNQKEIINFKEAFGSICYMFLFLGVCISTHGTIHPFVLLASWIFLRFFLDHLIRFCLFFFFDFGADYMFHQVTIMVNNKNIRFRHCNLRFHDKENHFHQFIHRELSNNGVQPIEKLSSKKDNVHYALFFSGLFFSLLHLMVFDPFHSKDALDFMWHLTAYPFILSVCFLVALILIVLTVVVSVELLYGSFLSILGISLGVFTFRLFKESDKKLLISLAVSICVCVLSSMVFWVKIIELEYTNVLYENVLLEIGLGLFILNTISYIFLRRKGEIENPLS